MSKLLIFLHHLLVLLGLYVHSKKFFFKSVYNRNWKNIFFQMNRQTDKTDRTDGCVCSIIGKIIVFLLLKHTTITMTWSLPINSKQCNAMQPTFIYSSIRLSIHPTIHSSIHRYELPVIMRVYVRVWLQALQQLEAARHCNLIAMLWCYCLSRSLSECKQKLIECSCKYLNMFPIHTLFLSLPPPVSFHFNCTIKHWLMTDGLSLIS